MRRLRVGLGLGTPRKLSGEIANPNDQNSLRNKIWRKFSFRGKPKNINISTSAPQQMLPAPGSDAPQDSEDDKQTACENAVINCFPDICPDYLKTAVAEHQGDPEQLINHILEKVDEGTPYPKRLNTLKRKRSEEPQDSEKAIQKKFENADPVHQRGNVYFHEYTAAA